MGTKTIGDFGEDAATEYLENEDYEILERNFRVKAGEIDIIAEKDDTIVFVEVKTRADNHFGSPSEYVTARKMRCVKKAAACYTDTVNNAVRFDIIEVFYTGDKENMTVTQVNHIENAF